LGREIAYWKGRELSIIPHHELCELVVQLDRENKSLRKSLYLERVKALEEKMRPKTWLERIFLR
jgi:hypothetical protein